MNKKSILRRSLCLLLGALMVCPPLGLTAGAESAVESEIGTEAYAAGKPSLNFSIKSAAAKLAALIPSAAEDNTLLASHTYDKTEVTDSGECGENINWELHKSGTIYIFGTGEMPETSWTDSADKITGVVVEEGVESISRNAFYNCRNITAISFPESLTTICGRTYSYNHDGDHGAFEGCILLKSLKFANGVQKIGRNAFSGCTKLEAVSFGTGLSSVGPFAFYNCDKLKTVVFPKTDYAPVIEEQAFRNCTSLSEIEMETSVSSIGYAAFADCTAIKTITLPDSVQSIGMDAFMNCTSLEAVTLSEGIEEIGRGAFYNCRDLTTINFPETLRNIYGRNYNYTHDDDYGAFEACILLKNIKFPSSLDFIGRQAFSDCTKLEEVNFGDGLTTLDYAAFRNCTRLKKVVFPEIKYDLSIGGEAFKGCTALTELT